MLEQRRVILGLVALATGLSLAAPGCRRRSAQAAPPVIAAPTPVATAPAPPQRTEREPESKPEPAPATTAPPALVVPPKPAPAKPRETPAPPAAIEPATPKPAPPHISPRLSPAEQVEYERAAREAIAAAERNLQHTHGKNLTTAQRDLVEKIRGFLAQSHEAIRAGDWVRTRNLAQKAQVLSVELITSLER